MSYLDNKCECKSGKIVIPKERLERNNLCKEVIHDYGQGCDRFTPRARCCGMCLAWYECHKADKYHSIPCYPVRTLVQESIDNGKYVKPKYEVIEGNRIVRRAS